MIRWITTLAAWLALSGCEPSSEAPPSEPAVAREVAADLFARNCALCHGENGDGNGPRRASLFRKPPDFRSALWRESRSAADLRRAIRDGLPTSDMPAWSRLGEAAIAGLADYVLSLGDGGNSS